ncbi:DNA-binding protein [Paramicrobacterium fandaimingii]|uniref:DNA-binding protein n=1 Tax=Paramicrobacterium fandaimingii TaxID=2708079 RepID=UPI0014244762|nr:DNA-binding protein [Microbacterium fandaimingii]
MQRNPDFEQSSANAEQLHASREERARDRVMSRANGQIAEQPWRPAPVPPTAVDLVNFSVWRSMDAESDELADALALLPAARAEVEGLEAGMLFAARSAGLTWAQIASAMGFRSPQACQQHYARLLDRHEAQ